MLLHYNSWPNTANYKDKLQEMLRNRLVCGVNQSGMQKRLLTEKDLTFDKALDIAKALEVAKKDTQDLKSDTTVPRRSFHLTSQTQGRHYKNATETCHQEPCYRCGRAHKCKDWDCLICKKKGRIARVCKFKKPDARHQKSSSKSQLVSEHEQTTRDYSYDMFSARTNLLLFMSLNRVPVTVELDTDASLSVINKDTYNHINTVATTSMTKSPVKLKTYIGESIPIIVVLMYV